jgi:chromosome partitioning protein
MSGRRISFVNFKGGVGKTSLAVNVAACLAFNLNQKVLLVDCDPQSNASIWLMGVPRWNEVNNKPGGSIYGMFLPNLPPVVNNVITSVVRDESGVRAIPNLDLLPATYELLELEEEYQDKNGDPVYYRFHEHLRSLFNQYDYILFDCPPNLYRASKCAIFASQEIYVPCNPDKLSEIGLALLVKKIERFHKQTTIQQQLIPGYVPAKVRGIILNDVDSRANLNMIIQYMRLTLLGAKRYRVVSDDADILSQIIRKAVFAAGVVNSFLPVALTKVNPNLKEDYLNLSRYIHNTPLDKKVEINGTERQNRAPRRADRQKTKD